MPFLVFWRKNAPLNTESPFLGVGSYFGNHVMLLATLILWFIMYSCQIRQYLTEIHTIETTSTLTFFFTDCGEKDFYSKEVGRLEKKWPPRRGIEPRSPAWQAGILTTILTRMSYFTEKNWGTISCFFLNSTFSM